MTDAIKKNIRCPRCRKNHEVTLWNYINTELHPKAKEKLLDGTLFRFTCDCGYTAEIAIPLIYHDEKHKAVIHYVPEEYAEYEERNLEKSPGLYLAKRLRKQIRIVTCHHHLREKAVIFSEGLDDRVIEFIKADAFNELLEQVPEAEWENLYFRKNNEKYCLEYEGKESYTTELPPDLYRETARKFADRLRETKGNYYIDFNWAILEMLKADAAECIN